MYQSIFINFGEGMSYDLHKKRKDQSERLNFFQQFIRTPERLKSKIIEQESTISQSKLKRQKSLSLYQGWHRKINILLVPDYAHEKVLQSLIDEQNNIQKQKFESSQSQYKNIVEVYHQGNSYKSQFEKLSKLLNEKSLINKYLWQHSGEDKIEGIHLLKDKSKYEAKYCIQFRESEEKQKRQKHLSSIIEDDSDKMRQSSNQIKNNLQNRVKIDDQFKIPYVLAQKSGIIKKTKKGVEKKITNERQSLVVNTDLNSLLHETNSINSLKMYNNYSNKKTCARTNLGSESEKNSYSEMVRDLNLNVWHAHGLKFRSNVLKFGLQKKEIVIIVYHKQKTYETTQLSQQWSKFIREINKKCIIGHLFIKQIPQKESNKKGENNENAAGLQQMAEDEIQIIQNIFKLRSFDIRKPYKNEKQFEINIKIHKTTKSKKNASVQRILKVVDHLLSEAHSQSNESGFSFQNQQTPLSYSKILKRPHNYTSQPIKKSPYFELNSPWNNFIPENNYSTPIIKKTNIHVKLDNVRMKNSEQKKEQQGWNVIKYLRNHFCCQENKIQQQQISIKIEKPQSMSMIPNRNNRSCFGGFSMNLRNQSNKKATRKKSINSILN